MNLDSIRDYTLSLPHVTEDQPFGPEILVFRIGGKIFALLVLDEHPLRINLKCNPEKAIELREEHDWVIPGYHMNKKHWNTLVLEDYAKPKLVFHLVEHSYDLVFSSLSKAQKTLLST